MNTGVLMQILDTLQAALIPGLTALRPILLRLIALLVFLEILRLMAGVIFAHAPLATGLIRLVMRTSVLLTVFLALPAVANGILAQATTLGLIAGGNSITTGQFLDLSAWFDTGLTAGRSLLAAFGKLGYLSMATLGLFYLGAWLVLVGAYLYMDLSLFVLQIQFSLALVGSQVLLAFAATRWTSWMAQGAVAYPINVAFRFLLKAVLASLIFPILKQLNERPVVLPTDVGNLEPGLILVTVPFVLALLFWKSDAIAAGLLAGLPAFTAGTVVQAAAGAVVVGGTVGPLAARGAGAAVAGLGQASGAVVRGVGAASTAYQLGAATSPGGTLAQIGGGVRGIARAAGGLASRYLHSIPGPSMSGLRSTMQAGRQAGWVYTGGALPPTMQPPPRAGQTVPPSHSPTFGQQLRSTLQTTAYYFGNDQSHGGVHPPL
jgi:type IV secretion system protein TrbL